MIDAKKIKAFENAITRLLYVGGAGRWAALVDSEGRMTLLCELIKSTDRDYMKENYGYDIDGHLEEEPTNNLLLVINPNSDELLHAFESGREFSLSKIPELEHFYLNSNDVNFRGLGRHWNKDRFFRVLYLLVMFILGCFLAKWL